MWGKHQTCSTSLRIFFIIWAIVSIITCINLLFRVVFYQGLTLFYQCRSGNSTTSPQILKYFKTHQKAFYTSSPTDDNITGILKQYWVLNNFTFWVESVGIIWSMLIETGFVSACVWGSQSNLFICVENWYDSRWQLLILIWLFLCNFLFIYVS